MRVVVTGGAGLVGSAFVWKLNREGITDILVVDSLGTDAKWKNLVPLRFADIAAPSAFLADPQAFRPDAIVHMGACSATTERDADYLLDNNYRYTKTLAQWSADNNVRFVNASSAATYGDGEQGFDDDPALVPSLVPINMYGYSKQLFDLYAQRTGLDKKTVSLKFFNVFGPNEYHKAGMVSMVFRAFHQIESEGLVRLFRSHRPDYSDGGQMRDFIYVKDVCDAMWWLVQNPHVNGLFNLGTGKARSWNDLAQAVFAALGKPPQIEYIPMPDALVGQYQYFTQARMDRLSDAGCPVTFASLEDSVRDYVQKYLAPGVRALHPDQA